MSSWKRRFLALVSAVALVAGGLALWSSSAGAATLVTPSWAASSTVTSATGVTYTYTFVTATGSNLSQATFTVPAGTTGTPALGTASGLPAGGTTALAANTITYSFGTTFLNAGVAVSISFTGLKNSATAGSYTSTITTMSPTPATVDTATTPPVALAATALTVGSWSVSSPQTSATSSYTFGATTSHAATLVSVSMSVPIGTTAGTLSVGSVTGVPTGGTAALTSGVLTYTFASTAIGNTTKISVTINGLVNTGTSQSFTPQIYTSTATSPDGAGTGSTVSFAAGLLSAVSWSPSSTLTSATGVQYSFAFTTATAGTITKIQLSVPAGTAGTPTVVSSTGIPTGGTVALASNLLTYTASGYVNTPVASTLVIGGLTNTATAGTYSSQITTFTAAGPLDAGITSGVPLSASALTSPSWSTSSGLISDTGVTYSFSATTATTSTLTSFIASVPAGTAGTPSISSVSGLPSGGTVVLSGGDLIYTFTGTATPSGTAFKISIGGLTNTSTVGTYTSLLATSAATGPVNSATTTAVAFASGTLSSPVWSVSSAHTGTTAVAYSYSFTTPGTPGANMTSLTMTVPVGTAGTPAVGTVSGIPSGGTITLSGSVLTYTFTSTFLNPSTAVSIRITGLTNTATAGTYTAEITTLGSTSTPPPTYPIQTGISNAVSFSAGTLTAPVWTTSNAATGATGVTYTYSFKTATTATLTSVSFTVPPGTSGIPSVVSVTGVPTGGTVALSGTTLTYSFTGTSVPSATAVVIQIGSITNTSTAGNYYTDIATSSSTGPVDTGLTSTVTFTAGTLSAPIWTTTSSVASGTGVSYTYTFTTTAAGTLTSVTMTVPPGTAGTPAVGAVSGVPTGGTIALSLNTLTYSFTGTYVGSSVAVSIQVTGLTNTASVGSYTSQITTNLATGPLATGTTAPIAISGGTLVSPIWATSNAGVGASGATYTYTFRTVSTATLTSVSFTVPPGTAGTPAVGTVSGLPVGGTVALSGGTLTYSFTGTSIPATTNVSVAISGLTNTATAGSYTAQITTSASTGPIDSGITAPVSFSSGVLSSPTWAVSNTTSGQTGVTYTYTFTTGTGATLTSVSMTVPPLTAGTPVVGTITGVPTGGTISLASNTLTYTFPTGTYVNAGTAVSIQITGMKNTTTGGTYTSQITTSSATSTVDTGTTGSVSILGGNLVTPTWSVSNSAAGQTAVTYTYGFKTTTTSNLSSVTMTVPSGTAGTPVRGTITGVPATGTVALAANVITYTFTSTSIPSGTTVSLQFTGLTNTSTVGSYTSNLATKNGATVVDVGTTPTVVISGLLTLTAPTSLTWAVTLNGTPQWTTDATTADQQYTVDDQTGSGLGWHVTVSATTFTTGTYSLADTGSFQTNGSVSLLSSTAGPSAQCVSTCTLPTNTSTYPVAITTAASSPTAYTIFDTAAGTGLGNILIGGSSSANPIGWWINVPATARAGVYTSTVTFSVISAP